MGITFTLPVPLRNQLGEVTTDGKPNENDHYNCVATSIADALTFRLKRPYYGDQLKDAVYGQSYTGGQAAIRYVSYCANLGVPLQAINGNQDALVAALHHEIEAGNPCLVTMPSLWGSAPSQPGWNPQAPNGWTHVGLACGDGAGWIRVMNPWGGFWHDGSDDYWRVRLCYGQVWRVGPVRQGGSMTSVPAGWTDDGTTLKAPNGVPVVRGFRTHVLDYAGGWDKDNWPLNAEFYSSSIEPGNPRIGPGSRQDFRLCSLGISHDEVKDTWGNVYHIYIGQDIIAMRSQIATLQQQLAAAQSAPHPEPLTPYQQACIAAAEAGMAATSALASATALRGK